MTEPASAHALNQLTGRIIDAAIRIHRRIGPGLLENAYLACLCHELRAARIDYELQKSLSLRYEDVAVGCVYRADLVVDERVLVEVKAVETHLPIHVRQLQTYVRLAACPVGLLLNFGAPTMKAGITRIVNNFPD